MRTLGPATAFALSLCSQALAETNTLRLACIEDLYEQQVGVYILKQLYTELGVDLEIVSVPAKRAQNMAEHGLVDGEVMRIADYAGPNSSLLRVPSHYFALNTTAFFLAERKITINSVEDLAKYRVAITRGVKHSELITRHVDRLQVLNSTEQTFSLVEKGRADIAITSLSQGMHIISGEHLTKPFSYTANLSHSPLYHYLHPSKLTLASRIEELIQSKQQSGELAVIIEQAKSSIRSKAVDLERLP